MPSCKISCPFKLLHPLNTSLGIIFIFWGILIEPVRPLHSLNALDPKYFNVLGRMSVPDRFLFLEKAPIPIYSNCEGKFNSPEKLHSENALDPIFLRVEGSCRVPFKEEHELNAASSIISTPSGIIKLPVRFVPANPLMTFNVSGNINFSRLCLEPV